MRATLRSGVGAGLVLAIMLLGSFGLWIGTPLLWLWIGGQVEGATNSLGTAVGTMGLGALVTIVLFAAVLAKLSDAYRVNRQSRGHDDPGHVVLEGVLVVSAGIAMAAFLVWFFLLSGAAPIPIGFKV
jgi:hypothetical protein